MASSTSYSYLVYGLLGLASHLAVVLSESSTSSTTTSTTPAPTTTTAAPGRSFDGVSFIGGIIFACIAIVGALLIYKYCANRKKNGENYGVF